ncbi:MAG TPA: hypothetical protein VKQ09_04110 [Sphingomonas sp.]|nr:hypothetical protein [Sphingomonas sp.]
MSGVDFSGLAARELALFAAAGFLIGGIDDLIVDLVWIGRSLCAGRRSTAATPAPTRAPCPRLPIPAGSPCSCPSAVLRLPVAHRTVALALGWHERMLGTAKPGSGVALTLASDF